MKKSPDHQRLMNVLNKMAVQEKWKKMPKSRGRITATGLTKNGNIKIVLHANAGEKAVYILKKNKNLYETAQRLKVGDIISVSLRRYLGKLYCTRLARSEKKVSKRRTGKYHLVSESESVDLRKWVTS